jgi:hypothetical protein
MVFLGEWGRVKNRSDWVDFFSYKAYIRHMNTIIRQNMKVFLNGFASAFDISGRYLIDLHDISGGFEQDRMMLYGDWAHIGNDIRKVMYKVAHGKQ